MNKKSQQGIALLWIIIAGTFLITGIGVSVSKKGVSKIKRLEQQISPAPSPKSLPPDFLNWLDKGKKQEPLLKILPPKERAELESAIRETQQVLKNIEVFDYTPPSINDINKGLNRINKQTQEQIKQNIEKQQQEFQRKYQQEIDLKKIEEYFRQNPPAAPYSPPEGEGPSSEEQEYYYRKYILKDPAFQ